MTAGSWTGDQDPSNVQSKHVAVRSRGQLVEAGLNLVSISS